MNNTTRGLVSHLGSADTHAVAAFYLIFGILGIIGNVSIILVIATSRVYRRRFSGLFLLNLAFADCLVCLTATPYYVTSLVLKQDIPADHDPQGSGYNAICKLPMFFNYFTASLRILSLTAMSVDRYIAINHPYFYTRRCTYDVSKSWGLTVVVYVWFQGIASMLPPMADKNLMKIVFYGSNGRLCGIMWSKSNFAFVATMMLFNFVLPAITIVFTNCKVFWLARKQVERERIKKQRSGRSFAFKNVRARLRNERDKHFDNQKTPKRVAIVLNGPQNQLTHYQGGEAPPNNNKLYLNVPKSDTVGTTDDRSTITMETLAPDNDIPWSEEETRAEKRRKTQIEVKTRRQSNRSRESRTSSDWEIALSTLSLVIFYFVSYLPFMVTRLMTLSSENSLSLQVVAYTTLLTTFDSAINPLIVLKTRREFRKILRQKCCGSNSVGLDLTMWSSSKIEE